MFEWFIKAVTSYIDAGMPCVFHLYSGYYCPGCGGTRSVIALLHGDITRSFIYHPLPLFVIASAGVLFFFHIKDRSAKEKLIPICVAALILVITNFIVKNALLYNGIDLLTSISSQV